MTPADLKRLYGISHQALHVNIAGVTDDEAIHQPEPGGNCLNWTVGHIVASRNGVFHALGRELHWTPEEASRYKRGSAPITRSGEGKPLAKLVQDLDRSQEKIQAALDSVTEADLAKPHDAKQTVGDWITFLHFHEAYHVGQTGLLRRLVGKEGAIR
jgi:uncharacterized damage-inducible protein DinB